MRKALVVADKEDLLRLNCRAVESIGLKDLVLFSAEDKDKALDELSYGDFEFVILDDDVPEAVDIAAEANRMGADLYIITADGNKDYASTKFASKNLVECFEKPNYISALINIFRILYKVK